MYIGHISIDEAVEQLECFINGGVCKVEPEGALIMALHSFLADRAEDNGIHRVVKLYKQIRDTSNVPATQQISEMPFDWKSITIGTLHILKGEWSAWDEVYKLAETRAMKLHAKKRLSILQERIELIEMAIASQ